MSNKLREAVDYLKDIQEPDMQKVSTVCHMLQISPAYLYKCIAKGEISMVVATKIEILTEGKFNRDDLAPHIARKAAVVTKRPRIA